MRRSHNVIITGAITDLLHTTAKSLYVSGVDVKIVRKAIQAAEKGAAIRNLHGRDPLGFGVGTPNHARQMLSLKGGGEAGF